ncbi:codeine O-demethylase-like isoform X1 [Camellia sinensis]|uniref:codeine O-demethylase-like isoform X1 n=1 Tax=Camellia sinensis TaxID=4442 RepID=UPI001036CDFE|nr:codeine O-demethylase-like isoform X1 [Camellia sinensis]
MASSKPKGLGSSLTIQELAKEPMLVIPERYVRLDNEPCPILSEDATSQTIPTVDMQQLLMVEATDFQLDRLHSICKEWGIFQLVNHGVSPLLVEKLKYEIIEFYKLPLEQKMKYKIQPGDVEGYGQTLLMQDDEKLDWADRFYMVINPVHRRKAHLLPQLPSSLRETLESYISELQKLATTVFGLMTKALKIDKGEMEEMFDDGVQSVRMSYYPPCPQPEMVMGLRPHSDATCITILLQVNGVEGFQVKKDGIWIPVNFLPDAFVVNVGDTLEISSGYGQVKFNAPSSGTIWHFIEIYGINLQILSNGLYNSIEHRATVNSVNERMSIAMFFNPKFEVEVGPATSLLNPQNPPLFKRVSMEKYYKYFFSHKLNGKSFLEQMKIGNEEDDTA